jgi:hypothetical protein
MKTSALRRLGRAPFMALGVITVVALGWRGAQAPDDLPVLRVVKSPSCGCCTAWVEYMEQQGFTVEVEHREEFTALKRANGVTAELQGCHTGFVDGLVVEGHVPADIVRKLLANRPKGVKGVSAPGMPRGSPGMEGPVKDRYTVFTFDTKGNKTPYAVR